MYRHAVITSDSHYYYVIVIIIINLIAAHYKLRTIFLLLFNIRFKYVSLILRGCSYGRREVCRKGDFGRAYFPFILTNSMINCSTINWITVILI